MKLFFQPICLPEDKALKLPTSEHDHERSEDDQRNYQHPKMTVKIANIKDDHGNCQHLSMTMEIANIQRLLWKLATSEHYHGDWQHLNMTVEIATI